jgi:hypothetical protein
VIVVYIYDIKAKNKRKFNRVKRRFYYHLNKLGLDRSLWKTKSTIAVRPRKARMMDAFFQDFGSDVLVYKIRASSVEELE